MIKELCNFFTVKFAAKVELYLKIQVALQEDIEEGMVRELRSVIEQLEPEVRMDNS